MLRITKFAQSVVGGFGKVVDSIQKSTIEVKNDVRFHLTKLFAKIRKFFHNNTCVAIPATVFFTNLHLASSGLRPCINPVGLTRCQYIRHAATRLRHIYGPKTFLARLLFYM